MITQTDIERLAELARIELTQSEKEALVPEIDAILGYVAKIQEATGTELEAKTKEKTGAVKNVTRPDVALNAPSEYTQAILAEAPHRVEDYVAVQKIIAQD